MNDKYQLELIKKLITDVTEEYDHEEVLHRLLEEKISADIEEENQERITIGQRAADGIAHFAGSWVFIFAFTFLLLGWMVWNVVMATRAFDPYPYILLNLVLSCIAAVQAPLIMMSQNRQEEKDRKKAENNYKINLKSEFFIEDLHKKMDELLRMQDEIQRILEHKEK